MQLKLYRTTINHQTYGLGSTKIGLAFVGKANGPADEWHQFFPAATTTIDEAANRPAATALADYLAGRTHQFNLPLDQQHGTELQRQVWQALRELPYGTTTTYTAVAAKIGHPTAVRAVATAVGKNPLLIVVPCHRVCRKDGQLGGYRGGLPMKAALLALEKSLKRHTETCLTCRVM